MLSDEHDPIGALDSDNREHVDVERQPWHFGSGSDLSDETLIIEPDYPDPDALAYTPEPAHTRVHEAPIRVELDEEPEPVQPVQPPEPVELAAPRLVSPRRRVAKTPLAEKSAAAASRLSPPGPPQARTRTPRTSRINPAARNRAANGGTAGRDMQVAVAVGVGFGIVALACFKVGPVAAMVLVTAVVVLAAAEAFAAFRRSQYHPATLLGLVAVLSLMFESYNKGVSALPLILVLLVAGCFVWFLAKVEPAADPVAGMVSTVFVFGWVGGFGSFAALLVNPTLFPNRHGVAFLLGAVIITVAADVTALLVGSAMGRHPLAPSVSPNKSWEGVIGGALAAVLSAVIIVHFIHPWTIGKAAVLGLVIAVVSPLGDLSQSMIKRHLGMKDMGSILPGHGGLLDRFDGLLFVLPATYFVVKALHLG